MASCSDVRGNPDFLQFFSQRSVAQDRSINPVTADNSANTAGEATATIQFLPAQPANGSSYPSHVHIVGNKFIIDGGPVRLWFDLYISDWADTGQLTYGAQIVLDSDSVKNESGVDLIIPTDGCTSNADCESSLGPGSECATFIPNFCGTNCCRPGFVEYEKFNWVDINCEPSPWELAIVNTASRDFGYGRYCDIICGQRSDCGGNYYYGTLAIDVPPDAVGTYHIDIVPYFSYILDTYGGAIPFEYIAPSIEISPVQCCDTNFTCVADVISVNECLSLSSSNFYATGKTCDDACICPRDSDGDGACDSFDGCPNDRNKTSPGICGCGVNDSIDIDEDDVPDCVDVFTLPATSTWGMILLILAFTILITVKTYRKSNRVHP